MKSKVIIDRTKPRVLRHRRKILAPMFYLVLFVSLFMSWNLSKELLAVYRGATFSDPIFGVGGFCLSCVFLFWTWKTMRTSVVTLSDRLKIKRGKRITEIAYSELRAIIPASGWSIFVLKLNDGRTFKFSHLLERCDYILDAVYLFNPHLMNNKEYHLLRARVVYADHFHAIKADYSKQVGRWYVFAIVTCAGITWSTLHWQSKTQGLAANQSSVFTWIVCFAIIWFASIHAYWVRHVLAPTRKRLEKGIGTKIRDIELESATFKKWMRLNLIAPLVVLIALPLLQLNTIRSVKSPVDIAEIGIVRGQEIWIDHLSACYSCPQAAKKDDRLLIIAGPKQFHSAQVTGVAGDSAVYWDWDHQGRAIASNDPRIVPRGAIAIFSSTLPQAKTVLVSPRQVLGRPYSSLWDLLSARWSWK